MFYIIAVSNFFTSYKEKFGQTSSSYMCLESDVHDNWLQLYFDSELGGVHKSYNTLNRVPRVFVLHVLHVLKCLYFEFYPLLSSTVLMVTSCKCSNKWSQIFARHLLQIKNSSELWSIWGQVRVISIMILSCIRLGHTFSLSLYIWVLS